LYVGCVRDEVVGFAVGRVAAGEGEIESIAVLEGERRLGVGMALLAAVLGWCWGEGAGVVELEVRAGSARAQRLYARAGFVEVGRRVGYYDDPREDAVLMRVVGG
jgi:ribosomal-protein-alanine N-acetyltransferase